VPPVASGLLPKRMIRVRMRYAENGERAYLVTWIIPPLVISQKIALPLLKKRTLTAPSEAENNPFPVAQGTLELTLLGTSPQGHQGLVDQILEDSRNLDESEQGQALNTPHPESDNTGLLLGNYTGGTPLDNASESERTARGLWKSRMLASTLAHSA
jgi:hypothetical protein